MRSTWAAFLTASVKRPHAAGSTRHTHRSRADGVVAVVVVVVVVVAGIDTPRALRAVAAAVRHETAALRRSADPACTTASGSAG